MKLSPLIQKHKYLAFLPALAVMLLIFRSSAQTYTEQDMRPFLANILPLDWIAVTFRNVSFTYAGSIVSIETVGATGFIEFFIRKGAHFTVFFFLSFFLFIAFYYITKKFFRSAMYTMAGYTLYAILDETHQSFTGDRTPLAQDVLVDYIGGTTALILIFIYLYIKKKRVKDM